MKVLYEDNHILAVLKPGGIPTQPPPDNSQISIEDIAKEMIRERDLKKGGVFLHAVHRLDKDAYGIVIFAKTQKALSRLMESMRNGLWRKEYIAIVHGKKTDSSGYLGIYPNNLKNRGFSDAEALRFDSEKSSPLLGIGADFSKSKMSASVKEKTDSSGYLGIYEDYIIHGDHKASIVSKNNPQAKKALLEVVAAALLSHETWQLRIVLHTGRYHQIRAQLSERGIPVVGDKKYGSTQSFPKGIALSHVKVEFPHPTLKENVVLEVQADQFFEMEELD